jgi:tetratricopeptide (TPR) repeat protein
MGTPALSLILLIVGCFSLSTWLGPQFDRLSHGGEDGFMGQTLGESRKFLASHFFTRSDIYFHSGYYPSVFDRARAAEQENHVAGGSERHGDKDEDQEGHAHNEHCDHGEEAWGFLGKPKDRMDAFTRNFFVSAHTHLTDKGTNAAREILPWIKLTAQLDPGKVDSYTVGAYWLRNLGRTNEAEAFLREGFRRNPLSHEILFEMGRMYLEKRDYIRARNLLELAIRSWRDKEGSKPAEQQNLLSARQIVDNLALVEDRTGNRERVIQWLEIAKTLSPHPEAIEKRIAEVRAGQPLAAE